MKKKIFIPSAILVALTIGGITMANQPVQPVKQSAQATNTTTTEPTIEAVPVTVPLDATNSQTPPVVGTVTPPVADNPVPDETPVAQPSLDASPTVPSVPTPNPQQPKTTDETSNVANHSTSIDAVSITY